MVKKNQKPLVEAFWFGCVIFWMTFFCSGEAGAMEIEWEGNARGSECDDGAQTCGSTASPPLCPVARRFSDSVPASSAAPVSAAGLSSSPAC